MESESLNHRRHTQVPQIVADVVAPLLTPPERDCLLYIVRRTYGFAEGAGRRARDTISVSQFEHGISSGNYLLDLGTQLSRTTIRKALESLQEKEIVEARFSCTKCFWEEGRDDAREPKSIEGEGAACPRCAATLARSWALVELTPRKVAEFLNTYDKHNRSWTWDREAKKFRWEAAEQDAERKRSQQDLREEALRLKSLLWYPNLVDQAAALAEQQLKAGSKLTLSRRINNFYKPVWDLQERFPNPPLIKFALEQTIKGPALRNPDTHRWYRYLARVIENNERRFAGGGPAPGTNAAQERAASPRARELAMRELLERAAELNDRGEREPARALLSDILAQVSELAVLFEGDKERCEFALREAFKQGATDFVSIRPNPRGVDFYPEWTWAADKLPPRDEPLA